MADLTDAEKTAAREKQKSEFKALFKESMTEFLAENTDKQRTTGREVQDENKKSGSIFEIFGF